jgi:hypothetical protein
MEQIYAIGLWYDNNGLYNIQLDYIFAISKIIIIYMMMSLPFILHFKGESDVLDNDIVFRMDYLGLYIYLSITHFIVGFFMTVKYHEDVKKLKLQKDYFTEKGLDIDDTRNSTLQNISDSTSVPIDDLHKEYLKINNILVACDDQKIFDNKFCGHLLYTLPFELLIKSLLESFFKDKNLSKIGDNSHMLKSLCKRAGIIVLPFIPTLLIYTFFNHILSNNTDVFSKYSYTRVSKWKTRLYNEFDKDLKYKYDSTISLSENLIVVYNMRKWKNTLYRITSFVFAAFAFLCTYCTFYGYEKIFNIDIYTLIGIFTAISAFTYPKNTILRGDELSEVNKILNTQLTTYELSLMISNKAYILLVETFSILLLPILLWFWLPDISYELCSFYGTYMEDGYTVFSLRKNKAMSTKSTKSFTIEI